MSQVSYRANLAADDFPLLSQLMGRTVIIDRISQDYELEVKASNSLQKQKQIAQALYVHNVMPTGQGYQSVGFVNKIEGISAETRFDSCYILRDANENKFLYSYAQGQNFVYNQNEAEWLTAGAIPDQENALVTVAFLQGITYIFIEKIGCFKYNSTTKLLETVTLTGLTVSNINGICVSMGYLLAWDDDNIVYRGQAVDVTNFTPDSALGSGSAIPEALAGKIVVVLPINNGYIVYTTKNAVAGTFQNNIRYPFTYKEVQGSSGIYYPHHVSWQDNVGVHYAWTLSGLQKVDKTSAQPAFPEVTDFLIAKILEDYDTVTDTFTVTKLASQLNVNVTFVGSRYLAISYGVTEYTHILVYDLAFKRWGKIKYTHVEVFEYATPNLSGDVSWEDLGTLSWDDLGNTTWSDLASGVDTFEKPKEVFAIMQQDGTIVVLNFDLIHVADSGVLVLGKYQLSRERRLIMDEIEFENVDQLFTNFGVRVLTSDNGKTISRISIPTLAESSDYFRKYLSRANGMNHLIVGLGTFHLTSLCLTFHNDGRR